MLHVTIQDIKGKEVLIFESGLQISFLHIRNL